MFRSTFLAVVLAVLPLASAGGVWTDDFDRSTLRSWTVVSGSAVLAPDDRAVHGADRALTMQALRGYVDVARLGETLGDGTLAFTWNPRTLADEWKNLYVSFRYDPEAHWTTYHRVDLRARPGLDGQVCYDDPETQTCWTFAWVEGKDYRVSIAHSHERVTVTVDGVVVGSAYDPAGAATLMFTVADDGHGQQVDDVVFVPAAGVGVEPPLEPPMFRIRK